MIINQAQFTTSVASMDAYQKIADGTPEIVVFGRSNVGKSSFLNMLCARNKLARTSQTPGRTRLVNVFSINNDQFRFIDLPGYGFASGSKAEVAGFSQLIQDYLHTSQSLVLAFFLLDIRRTPSELDLLMLDYMYRQGIPFCVAATKCDKLSKSQQARQKSQLASHLKLGIDNIIMTSAQTKQGREQLLQKISQFLPPQ